MIAVLLSLCVSVPQALWMAKDQKNNLCKYEKVIIAESVKNKIDPSLLTAVIYVESAFRPKAVSRENACGLTQVVPKWTGGRETRNRHYSCLELKNPKTSIKVGARVLSYAIHVYSKGNIDIGLCYYSSGTKCLTKKNYYKRSSYVKKVRRIWNKINEATKLRREL